MNDEDFQRHALSNPRDDHPDFLAAAAQTPQRRKWLDELQEFEARLEAALHVPVAETLRQRLLDPEGLPDRAAGAEEDSSDRPAWKRPLPLTLCLLLLVGGLLIGL